VEFGSVDKMVLKRFDIEKEVFYANFNWDLLLAMVPGRITYREVSRYPTVRRDLSMLVNRNVSFGQLKLIARATEQNILREVTVFDVYEGKATAAGDMGQTPPMPGGKRSYALSFTFQDEEKTLTDKQIDSVMQKLIINFEKEAGAEIRKA
jgi:phenylalanyl-tRNA synthetase beta chain